MMNLSGKKFVGDKIVSQSDLRAGTSNRIIKEKVRRIATWHVRSLGVCCKLRNIKMEMKQMYRDILRMSEIKWKDEGDFWSKYNGVFIKETKTAIQDLE
jgi:hypothetical protein